MIKKKEPCLQEKVCRYLHDDGKLGNGGLFMLVQKDITSSND